MDNFNFLLQTFIFFCYKWSDIIQEPNDNFSHGHNELCNFILVPAKYLFHYFLSFSGFGHSSFLGLNYRPRLRKDPFVDLVDAMSCSTKGMPKFRKKLEVICNMIHNRQEKTLSIMD